jgi:hypothetical protein
MNVCAKAPADHLQEHHKRGIFYNSQKFLFLNYRLNLQSKKSEAEIDKNPPKVSPFQMQVRVLRWQDGTQQKCIQRILAFTAFGSDIKAFKFAKLGGH